MTSIGLTKARIYIDGIIWMILSDKYIRLAFLRSRSLLEKKNLLYKEISDDIDLLPEPSESKIEIQRGTLSKKASFWKSFFSFSIQKVQDKFLRKFSIPIEIKAYMW